MENNFANEVETFIKRLRDGSIKIDERGQTITYEYGLGGNKSLSYILGEKISDYESSKEQSSPYYNPSPSEILKWINLAYTNGVIIESDSLLLQLTKKDETIDALKKENNELKQNNQKIAIDFVRLQGSYEELEKRLAKIVPGKDIKK